jgi:hypothetical protein
MVIPEVSSVYLLVVAAIMEEYAVCNQLGSRHFCRLVVAVLEVVLLLYLAVARHLKLDVWQYLQVKVVRIMAAA